jgi:N-dimethylarginine dimethylaminohydrolase
MITRSTGIASLEEVLSEDAAFPTTKQDLIHKQGWKLFDVTETERTRAGEYLERLPDGTYNDLTEVTDRLASMTR